MRREATRGTRNEQPRQRPPVPPATSRPSVPTLIALLPNPADGPFGVLSCMPAGKDAF